MKLSLSRGEQILFHEVLLFALFVFFDFGILARAGAGALPSAGLEGENSRILALGLVGFLFRSFGFNDDEFLPVSGISDAVGLWGHGPLFFELYSPPVPEKIGREGCCPAFPRGAAGVYALDDRLNRHLDKPKMGQLNPGLLSPA